MKWKIVIALTVLFMFVGCLPTIPELPRPTIIVEHPEEIPDYLYTINNLDEFSLWLWNNYHYTNDNVLFKIIDYPQTPAEMFMPQVILTNGNRIEKPILTGDCEDYAGLTAYILQEVLGYRAFVGIIRNTSAIGRHHMITYAYDEQGTCIIVNSPWVSIEYQSVDDYLSVAYPGKRFTNLTPISEYLEELYQKGHHKYWNEETE